LIAAPALAAADALRAAFDSLPQSIAALDREGVIVMVNAAWERFALDNGVGPGGAAHGSGVGIDYLALCDAVRGAEAGDARAVAQGIRALLAARRTSFSHEYPCHAPDRERWFRIELHPLAIEGGGVLVVHTDITARLSGERAREDSELRLSLALEATGDGLWDWHIPGERAYVSPRYCELVGRAPRDSEPGLEFFRGTVHPEDWPLVSAQIDAHLRGESAYSDVEYRLVSASGTMRWIRGRGRVVERDARGAPVRMVGLISDVTDRKRLEDALRESHERLSAVLQDQTEFIARFRQDGTVTFANEVYCRLFGYTESELVGRKWQPLAFPDDVAMIESKLAAISPANPVAVIENRVIDATGETRWMQFVNRALYGPDGTLREVQVVGRDITERKDFEARQQALLEENTRLGRELIRLQERERGALAKELHDELSQQIAAIRAYTAAIRRGGGRDKAKLRADAAAIEESARQIYDVSHRLMEGLHPHLLDSAGLADALRAWVGRWSERFPDVRVTLRLPIGADAGDADARIHVFRIVQECLTNVARHAKARAVRVFLGEAVAGGRRTLRLVVRDDGVGMDPGARNAGYGLIVIRERVHTLGGEWSLASRPGRGVRVAVEVPSAR